MGRSARLLEGASEGYVAEVPYRSPMHRRRVLPLVEFLNRDYASTVGDLLMSISAATPGVAQSAG